MEVTRTKGARKDLLTLNSELRAKTKVQFSLLLRPLRLLTPIKSKEKVILKTKGKEQQQIMSRYCTLRLQVIKDSSPLMDLPRRANLKQLNKINLLHPRVLFIKVQTLLSLIFP